MKSIVLGTIGIDDIETPTASVTGVLGGSATYASVAATFYSPCGIISIIGSDFDDQHQRLLEQRSIDLGGLQVIEGGETFRWGGRYHANFDGRDTIFTDLNVLPLQDPHLPENYRNTPYVLLGNTDPTVQIKVLDQLTDPNLVVVDTMNLWIETNPTLVEEVISRSNILIINEEEANLLSNKVNPSAMVEDLMAKGLEAVIVKRGSYGAVMRTTDNWFFVPAYPLVEVIDPTGAGDSFAGAFTGYLAKQNDLSQASLRKALVHGSVIASYTVQHFGVENLTKVTAEQISARYEEFLSFSQIEAGQ
tara:strand:+ start:738 stop:1652 length:915 start_codon:yes stop_codon:yes gene_type:complete